MDTFREDLLGLWIDPLGRLSLRIRRAPGGELVVTVWEGGGPERHVQEGPARWHPPSPTNGTTDTGRSLLGYLSIDLGLGPPYIGPAYDLLFAAVNHNPEAYYGYKIRPVAADDALDAVTIYPEAMMSFREMHVGRWDDEVQDEIAAYAWRHPLGSYRRGTPDEELAWATLP